ncbi:hypothetical protein PI124_g9890 [Phytophthora idaei]|nr:hypothetical protein PI125_g12309 [Phytophthora idaei]KAG3159960.1 hypothetical protein PI126_g7118 [Phytophthora idaei]KAG3245361.1 hypothetical protein PI124_g9890 [Phytophthora idaei]
MTKILRSAAAVASLALSMSAINVGAEELCSIAPLSYATAKTDYPDLAFAISAVEEYSIAAWYTDRLSTSDRAKMLKELTIKCSEDSRMTIVVYGIPNKDCNAGYSSGGAVSSTTDYEAFLSDLTTAVGDRKVLYVVEPDALGLLAEDGGCGSKAGYLENLKVAIKALSANANAELYVDVGYWTLEYEAQRSKVVTIMKELAASGTLKGSTDMTCIADTSRNYVAPTTTDWCNVLAAGIGSPPTSETNVSNLDYFMWIKPPGESDGTCNGGPAAGLFFETAFQKLWDQGYFVNKRGMNTIAEGGTDTTSSQTTSSQTTDSSASQTTDGSEAQTTDSSEAPTTDGSAPAAQDTGSATDTPDTTSSQMTESSAYQDTESSASQTTEATTDPPAATTEAPVAQTNNCKVKRRFRKL